MADPKEIAARAEMAAKATRETVQSVSEKLASDLGMNKDDKEVRPGDAASLPNRPAPVTVTTKSVAPPPEVVPPKRIPRNLAATAAPGEVPPTPRTAAPISIDELFDGIEAQQLSMPNFSQDPKSANPNVMFRWVNFKVGEEESSLRYQQMRAAGYVNASREDLQPDSPVMPYWREDQKAFINYDTIFMKIDRRRALGFIKGNMEMAQQLGSRMNLSANAKKELRGALRESGASAELTRKVQAFVPKGQELNEVFAGDEDQPQPGER